MKKLILVVVALVTMMATSISALSAGQYYRPGSWDDDISFYTSCIDEGVTEEEREILEKDMDVIIRDGGLTQGKLAEILNQGYMTQYKQDYIDLGLVDASALSTGKKAEQTVEPEPVPQPEPTVESEPVQQPETTVEPESVSQPEPTVETTIEATEHGQDDLVVTEKHRVDYSSTNEKEAYDQKREEAAKVLNETGQQEYKKAMEDYRTAQKVLVIVTVSIAIVGIVLFYIGILKKKIVVKLISIVLGIVAVLCVVTMVSLEKPAEPVVYQAEDISFGSELYGEKAPYTFYLGGDNQ